ncbi:MAG: hypothetical protein R2747_20380 [Pyrinomonadaceae bacterium]
MTIKNFGGRVKSVWEGLRPLTKKMLVGAMQANGEKPANTSTQKFSYDAHADWELSRLLSALDEQSTEPEIIKDPEKLNEIKQMAETCARVLQSKTESAEVFIQLAERALARNNYNLLDRLGDTLSERFSAGEVAEVIRQTKIPHISAIAYETLAMKNVSAIMPLLEDSIYFEIARNVLEQQAFEFDNDEAQAILDEMDFEDFDFE